MIEQRNVEIDADVLAAPFELPCGVVLKNRLAKAAMSDSLGDGAGRPTDEQVELYRRWSTGGAALSLIGEFKSTTAIRRDREISFSGPVPTMLVFVGS